MYDEPSYSVINVGIILNTQTVTMQMNEEVTGINPINCANDVGLSLWSGCVVSFPSNTTLSYGLNSSLGNYALGKLDQYVDTNNYRKSLPGSFYYENGTLFGLVDDNPDSLIDSTDALARIQGYLANNSTTFTVTSSAPLNSGGVDYRNGLVLAYSTQCPPLLSQMTENYVICNGDSVQLSANSQGVTYTWYPQIGLSNPNIPDPVASPTISTQYILAVTDSIGCHHTEHFKILVHPLPIGNGASVTDAVCGDMRGIAVVNPVNSGTPPFLYNIGTGNQVSTTFTNLNPGIYSVQIADSIGCTTSVTFNVAEVNTANADFLVQPNLVCLLDQPYIANLSGTINSYAWFINGTFVTNLQYLNYDFADTGNYIITLVGYHNLPQCADTVTQNLVVKLCPLDSFVIIAPSIFSPNSDGVNDTWLPRVSEYGFTIDRFHVSVLNRWGVVIFESDSEKVDWTGHTTAGVPAMDGTYYYVIEYSAVSGVVNRKGAIKGFIQLVR
jgi:gliding motility-associated-like protein